MMAVPNIIRYGVAESYDSKQGHRFFEGFPGFYGFRRGKFDKCSSYMVAQQLQPDNAVWWYCKAEGSGCSHCFLRVVFATNMQCATR